MSTHFETRFHIENLTVYTLISLKSVSSYGNTDSPLHTHSHYELQYIHQGEFAFEFENEQFTVGAHSLVIVPPSVFHRVVCLQDGRRTACSLSFQRKAQGDNAYARYAQPFFNIRSTVRFSCVLEELDALNGILNDPCITEWEKCCQVNALLTITLPKITDLLRVAADTEEYQQQNPGNKSLYVLQRISDLISSQYAEPLSIRDAAAFCYLSPRQVERILRQSGGKTFTNLLNEHRVQVAKERIRTTDQSLETISQAVGFDNYTTFWKNFHQMTGLSPSHYRRIKM